uniref:Putative malonyl-CoA-acyl carrier protein transacylase, mitochondrial n=1 Tax=Aceria tosichella TaxID=561515 RepID=A0A6G1SQ82_9ACAR
MSASVPRTIGDTAVKVFKDSAKSLRLLKKVDPRERYVLLFPSSDSAYVGMGFKLLNVPPAEKVFEHASDILKKNLIKLCLSGPKSELLNSMENRHLATFVTSHATLAKLEHERPRTIPLCKAAGGFGVGFVNSLVFGESMSFENALDLVQKQGQAMDRAAEVVPSARVKIRLLPATSKKRICLAAKEHCLSLGIPEEIGICSIAQQKHAHIVEIAGHEEAIKYLETEGERIFKFRWIRRILKTPQAFHSALMKPASDFLSVYLNQRIQEDPSYLREPQTCSVYSSTAGYRLRNVEHIKKDLVQYPCRSILTEQLIHCLFARPKTLAQPNIIVLWDKSLKECLLPVNRRAHEAAELFA